MQRRATTPTPPGRGRSLRLPVAALGAACALALAPGPAGAASSGPSTSFSGRIVSATGRFVNLRGAVRLVLRSNGAGTRTPGPSPAPYGFTLALSAPSCAGHHTAPPHRCVSLRGSLSGTALAAPRSSPDVGTGFALSGRGHVAPLGATTAGGTTAGLGFIAQGRFALTLSLRTTAGSVTIKAQGPLVKGFSSPF